MRFFTALFLSSLLAPAAFAAAEHRTVNGAVYTATSVYPDFGEAYVDPRGLVWSDVLSSGVISHYDAEKICAAHGAKLPSYEEFKLLAADLGVGSSAGYAKKTADGEYVLPHLDGMVLWSSTTFDDFNIGARVFSSEEGGFYLSYRGLHVAQARCVKPLP